MYVTTVRGRWYENILIGKFNGRKFFDTKISRITVYVIRSHECLPVQMDPPIAETVITSVGIYSVRLKVARSV